MNPHETPRDPFPETDSVADRNVERLLREAYRPEEPEAMFVQHVTAAMQTAAVRRAARPMTPRPQPATRRLIGWTVAAALLLGVGVLLGNALRDGEQGPAGEQSVEAPKEPVPPHAPSPAPLPPDSRRLLVHERESDRLAAATGLVARTRDQAPAAEPLAPGDSLETAPGQRRRATLPDGSVLYLNQNTAVVLDRSRHVTLERGEIYVEVSPRRPAEGAEVEPGATFAVATPNRQITALGTKFHVRLSDDVTQVAVTQGKVQVSGMDTPLLAGQQWTAQPGTAAEAASPIGPSPQPAHLLDWTRDLMAAAESPLVPASKYTGGALVVAEPGGQEANLSLRRYHVDVHIEDGFARTTIDQTYFNHLTGRLEGTFYFPLPPDASLSRLAMYVSGKLMEGGMVEREYARQVYEDIVRKMKDPALLEWIDGSTFKMRVFPLEGRQEKRIVLSYTQRLSSLYDRTAYRFPGGHNMQQVGRWSAKLRVVGGAGLKWESDSHEFGVSTEGDDLVLGTSAEDVRPDRDVHLTLHEKTRKRGLSPSGNDAATSSGIEGTVPFSGPLEAASRFSSAIHEGSQYLMLRWRPQLPKRQRHQRRDWVFLFEASADRDPLLARVQIDVIKTLLENAEHDDTFSIVTAGARVREFRAKPQAAVSENVSNAFEFLERTHLVGALDLGQAFDDCRPLVETAENPVLVHLGSGLPSLGEDEVDALLRRIPHRAQYVGVAVGKRWSRTLMKTAAGRSGGYFTQIHPHEPVNWRAFELLSTLNAPRLLNIRVVDDTGGHEFLCHNDHLADGEELCAIVRLDPGEPLPGAVEVTGLLRGKPFRRTIPVVEVAEGADYLPRTWAKLEIDRLVALGAIEHKPRIIELSKAMYVMSPFTSLLVLENEQMYRDKGIDRGRKDHWALYDCPDQIEVVHEPLGVPPANVAPEKPEPKRPTVEEVLQTIALRRSEPMLHWPHRYLQPPIVTLYNGQQRDGRYVGMFPEPTFSFVTVTTPVRVPDGGTLLLGGIHRLRGGDWRFDASTPMNVTGATFGVPILDGIPYVNHLFANAGIGRESESLMMMVTPRIIIQEEEEEWLGLDGDRAFAEAFVRKRRIVEQVIRTEVLNVVDEALLQMKADPEGAEQYLKINLENVRQAPDLHPTVRDQSIDLIRTALLAAEARKVEVERARQGQPGAQAATKERRLLLEEVLRKQHQTEQLMERFNAWMSENGDGTTEGAGAPGANSDSEFAARYVDEISRVLRQKAAVDTLYQMEYSHVPSPGGPAIAYPNVEVWRDLTSGRSRWTGGVTAVMSDGSTRFYSDEIDLGLWKALVDRDSLIDGDDSFLVPNGSLFVELYNPWPQTERGQGMMAWQGEERNVFYTPVYPVGDLVFPIESFANLRFGPMGLAQRGSMEKKIDDALKSPTKIEFTETPLQTAVDYLKDYHSIDIQINTRALEEVGIATDTPITKNLEGVSLRAALRLILRELDLTYVIEDGLLLITTPEEAETKLIAKSYDVSRFVLPLDNRYQGWQGGLGDLMLNYQHPYYNNRWHIFYDLLRYAPGMHNGRDDVLAVLETEAGPEPASKPGNIDPGARTLIEKARGAGWQTAEIADDQGNVLLSIDFDGTGRYRYRRTTARGLDEEVLCDGANLWHIYGELGIGARRTVSRFHRRQPSRLIPWLLPPAEDLARGADLVTIDERTVAVVPHGIDKFEDDGGKPLPYLCVHMIFDPDGRPAERRLVKMPSNKTLLRETCSADGTVRWLDAEDQLLFERKFALKPCGAPPLTPDTEKLVVLPMPARTVQHVRQTLPGQENLYAAWSENDALAMIAAGLKTDPGEAVRVIVERFLNRGDRRLGFYTLLLNAGRHWNPDETEKFDNNISLRLDPAEDHPGEPLAQYATAYLKIVAGKEEEFGPIPVTQRAAGFTPARQPEHQSAHQPAHKPPQEISLLHQLAEFRDLWSFFTTDRANQADDKTRNDRRERAWKYIREGRLPELRWALLGALRNHGGDARLQRRIAEAAESFEHIPALAYFARYERARALAAAGESKQARQSFAELYDDAIEAGFLPPVDGDFYQAFRDEDGRESWQALIRRTTTELIAAGARPAGVWVAWQVHTLGDPPLAEEVLSQVLSDLSDREQLATRLTAVRYLWRTDQHALAETVLRPLLENERYARWPSLWRLAALAAEKNDSPARAAECLARALDVEFDQLGETVDVRAIRTDYGKLLGYYQQMATAFAASGTEPPRDLIARVVRAADRWRSLDTDPSAACEAAAKIFGDLGAAELAWDYWTTPLAAKPIEAAPLLDLAGKLRQQAQFDLAARAYASAFETEPENVQILRDRAQVLLQAGRAEEASDLFRRAVEKQGKR